MKKTSAENNKTQWFLEDAESSGQDFSSIKRKKYLAMALLGGIALAQTTHLQASFGSFFRHVGHAITHPADTAKAVVHTVTHPAETAKILVHETKKTVNSTVHAVTHPAQVARSVAHVVAHPEKIVTSVASVVQSSVKATVGTIRDPGHALKKMTHDIGHAGIDMGDDVRTAAYATGDAFKYVGNKTLHGLKLAEKSVYKKLVVAGNATAKAMIKAGHSIEEVANATAHAYTELDADVKKLTGGLGVLDVLEVAFPEVADVHALIGVIQHPTDYQQWMMLGASSLGGEVLAKAGGKNAFKLADAMVRGGVGDGLVTFIKHPNTKNLGKLAEVTVTSGAGEMLGKKLQGKAPNLSKGIIAGVHGYEEYQHGKTMYNQGKVMQKAIHDGDYRGAFVAGAAIGQEAAHSHTGVAAGDRLKKNDRLRKAYEKGDAYMKKAQKANDAYERVQDAHHKIQTYKNGGHADASDPAHLVKAVALQNQNNQKKKVELKRAPSQKDQEQKKNIGQLMQGFAHNLHKKLGFGGFHF